MAMSDGKIGVTKIDKKKPKENREENRSHRRKKVDNQGGSQQPFILLSWPNFTAENQNSKLSQKDLLKMAGYAYADTKSNVTDSNLNGNNDESERNYMMEIKQRIVEIKGATLENGNGRSKENNETAGCADKV